MVGPLLPLAGIGMGLVIASMLSLGLPPELAGNASGLINNPQQLAGAIGIAVAAPVYFTGHPADLTATLLTVIGGGPARCTRHAAPAGWGRRASVIDGSPSL